MSPHEKISCNDSYKQAFNDANTALAIVVLCLKKCNVYIADVNKFKKACDDVASVLIVHNKTEELLHFYLWVRSKFTRLFLNANTRLDVKISCHADVKAIDICIKNLCKEMTGSKVVPLLIKLTYDTDKTKPTLHNH